MLPLFFCFFLLLLKHHRQDSIERELAPPFSFFCCSPKNHVQVSTKEKLELPLFFFFFLIFFSSRHMWAPSLSLGRGGVSASPFFLFFLFCFVVSRCRWAPSPSLAQFGSPFFLVASMHNWYHHQVLTDGDL